MMLNCLLTFITITTMTDFLYITGMFLAVMMAEVGLDNVLWKEGFNDKPGSTILRGVLLITLSLLNDFYLHDGTWYTTLFLGVSIYFLFFNYIINWTLKKPFFYLGNSWFDRMLGKLPAWPRLWMQIWILITAITIYLYYN